MKAIQLKYNFIYGATRLGVGNFAGENDIDTLDRQTGFLMERCPWLDAENVRKWLMSPNGNLVPAPDKFDSTLAAIDDLHDLSVITFDMAPEVVEAYEKWVAAGKPQQNKVHTPKQATK